MQDVIKIPQILIPAEADLSKWSTVACDQFVESASYWQNLGDYVGSAPSTLNLTCPEIFLRSGGIEEKTKRVHAAMDSCLREGFFSETEGFALVEREVEGGKKRLGLIISVDLECYDWRRIRVPIRATEDTILERLPVRIEIRKSAAIELPHVILLLDDPEKKVIEPLYEKRGEMKKLYDFELNMNGGHIRGYAVPDSQAVKDELMKFIDPAEQINKYGEDAGILFAVGDGNHSVATAKVCWDNLKETLTPEQRLNHPARFMLAELVNLHGEGMDFKPIHRLMYNPSPDFIQGLKSALSGEGRLKIIYRGKEEFIPCPEKASYTISAVQTYIETCLKQDKGLNVEYVHNEEHLATAVSESGGLGIVMPSFPNKELIDFVLKVGNLPKKAFSIGEPEHKRYYLEAKYII